MAWATAEVYESKEPLLMAMLNARAWVLAKESMLS
jgi:hypothetical protein